MEFWGHLLEGCIVELRKARRNNGRDKNFPIQQPVSSRFSSSGTTAETGWIIGIVNGRASRLPWVWFTKTELNNTEGQSRHHTGRLVWEGVWWKLQKGSARLLNAPTLAQLGRSDSGGWKLQEWFSTAFPRTPFVLYMWLGQTCI